MTYIEALTAMLESFGCKVDGSAVLLPGDDKPVMVEVDTINGKVKKELVLPTKDRLKENDWDEVVAFHPACENVTAGQSEIIKFLIRYVKATMIEKSFILVQELLKLEASTQKKKSTYAKYLSKFPDANKSTIKVFNEFKKGLSEKSTVGTMVNLAIGRKDYIEGDQFMRVLNFNSPIFTDTTDDTILMGVKLSTKTGKRALVAMFTDILFGGEQQRGSNADTPYLDVLMRFWAEFAKKYNSIVKMIAKDVKLTPIDISFEEELENMASFRRRVPALPGNTGDSIHKNKVVDDVDDEPPFDVDEVRKEDTSRRNERIERRPRYEDESKAASGLNFFRGNGRREERDERPSSTGNPLDYRYTGGRNSRRDRHRDDEDRDDSYSARSRRRDRDDRDDRRGGGLSLGGYSREERNRRSKFGR